MPSGAGARAAATPTLASGVNRSPAAARRAAGAAGRASTKPAPVRRRYSEYGEEYQYVWADLRRIALVGGVLTALLVVASFFIQ